MLWTLLVGLVVGALAKLFMPGKDPGGIIITILLGIGGSMGASYLGQTIGIYRAGEKAGFIGAIIGAMLILWLYRVIIKKRG